MFGVLNGEMGFVFIKSMYSRMVYCSIDICGDSHVNKLIAPLAMDHKVVIRSTVRTR